MSIERNHRNTIQGVVISDKNDKTIVVLVATHKKHAKYGKRVQYRKKYYVHDELNAARVGDTVTIMGTRPLSATKRFRLVSIDKKAVMTAKEVEGILASEEIVIEKEVEIVEVKEELPVEQPKVEVKAKAKKPKVKAEVVEEEAVEVKEEK